jgi:DNA repair exonuclease SbcCD nuclease subunit
MSRFLVFSDLHLNLWKYGSYLTEDGRNTRLEDQLNFFRYMYHYAVTNGIKYILFCGDFFHTPGQVRSEILQGAWQELSDCPDVEFIWLVGNHDQANKRGTIHSLDFLRQFGYVVGHQEGFRSSLSFPDLPPIHALNYVENEDTLKRFLDNAPKDSIVLMHQGVSGVDVNAKGFTLNEILKPEMIPDHILHAFAGHYHSHKRVNDKLTIPGAAMQHNWGDVGDVRGYLDVMIDGDNVHIKHVDSDCFRFVKWSYQVPTEEVDIGAFTKVTDVPSRKAADEIRSKLFELGALTVEVEFEEEEKDEIEEEQFESLDKLFEDYVKKNGIKDRQLGVGKEVMSSKYETP